MLNENLLKLAKNLAKEAPRSPRIQLGGFAILFRTIDKCRATILNQPGEYHFNCPLDKNLFSFKDLNSEEFKKFVSQGRTDEEILKWVNENGKKRSAKEIKAWSDKAENDYYYRDPAKKDWFVSECTRLGLDAEKTTLFDYLETDDRVSFKK